MVLCMILNLSDLSDEPLHGQISRQIREEILSGALNSGDSLASIRALARNNKVSVITVQRAYESLEREGLIVSRRGKGFFVNRMTDEEMTTMAESRFSEALNPVLQQARQEGLTAERIREIIDQELGAF